MKNKKYTDECPKCHSTDLAHCDGSSATEYGFLKMTYGREYQKITYNSYECCNCGHKWELKQTYNLTKVELLKD